MLMQNQDGILKGYFIRIYRSENFNLDCSHKSDKLIIKKVGKYNETDNCYRRPCIINT